MTHELVRSLSIIQPTPKAYLASKRSLFARLSGFFAYYEAEHLGFCGWPSLIMQVCYKCGRDHSFIEGQRAVCDDCALTISREIEFERRIDAQLAAVGVAP